MLLRNMLEPSNPEARRARDEIQGLLETAAMQQAESSASRRRELASELPVEPSRQEREREALVHPEHAPNGTRRPLSVSASSTTVNLEMPVTTSTSAGGVRVVTVQLKATMSIGAGATTTRRIEALHSSHPALGSLARPFAKHYFRLDSALPRPIPSITAKPNPNFGSPTFVWLASWVGLPMIGSSFNNFSYSYWTPPEPSSRTSHLDRSMTRATW
jgi:hypothetical protein